MTETKQQPQAPEKVYFDEVRYNHSFRAYESAAVFIQQALDAFNNLDIGKPDRAVLDAILSNNPESLKERYLKKIDSDIKETVKNRNIASKLFSMMDEPFNEWADLARKTFEKVEKRFMSGTAASTPYRVEWFTLKAGKVVFDAKELEKEFSIYLDTDQRKEFYSKALEAFKLLDELQTMAKQAAGNAIPGEIIATGNRQNCFGLVDMNNIVFNPEFLRNL
ncbi:hypothetical protein [Marinilabilia salmonicolor]|uniref:Uncharacterized protein n=1 Tax=Marinilabilia salmonicolor TaxID=989 RepID=A0A368URG9_9BACT|nr:hypothetical protein [Marinilabilia salmonicolor]RCW31382.1 hypothetical protein DFO77_11899 [Marinilabilia salmonicolor]